MADVAMPQLGETVTEGTITRWFKQVGEEIAEDEPLFEVSTDKVDSEVPSPMSGTVTEILVPEGETVEVGVVLARIGDADDAPAPAPEAEADDQADDEAADADDAAPAPAPADAPSAPAGDAGDADADAPAASPPPAPSGGGAGAGKLLSPVVRKLVNENNLDVDAIAGTGVGGRITRDDVLAAIDSGAASAPSSPSEDPAGPPAKGTSAAPVPRATDRDTVVAHTRIRRATAEHMRRSLDTSAHVYASIEVDFERVERVRRANKDEFKASEGFSLTYLPFISRAVIDAIAEYPEVNATFGPDELIIHNYVNLGIAVDLDFKGLLVPVIADAGSLRLRAIARSVSDLAARTRSKKLSPDELSGGTFTITNPGPFGTTLTMPVINQPQVAIVSTDGVKRRPVVVTDGDGAESIAIHSVGNLTMTWDHRAFDGAYAASFLARVADIIESQDWAQELA